MYPPNRVSLLDCASRLFLSIIAASSCYFLLCTDGYSQFLSGTSFGKLVHLNANDIAYNPQRQLIYASVPSKAGKPYGNSIVILDRELNVVSYFYVGSEPNALSISSDGTRLHIGIDGAYSFRSYEFDNEFLRPARLISKNDQDVRPLVATSISTSPSNADVIAVSKRDQFSTALPEIGMYSATEFAGDVSGPAQKNAFLNADYLIAVGKGFQGTTILRYAVDDLTLTREEFVNFQGFGELAFELTADKLFSSSGGAYQLFPIKFAGQLDAHGVMIPYSPDGVIFYLNQGTFSAHVVSSLLKLDSIDVVPKLPVSIKKLIHIGETKLAFVDGLGSLGTIDVPSMGTSPNLTTAADFDVRRGVIKSGRLDDTISVNGEYFSFVPGFTLNSNEPPCWLEFSTSISNREQLERLITLVDYQASTPNLRTNVSLFNFVEDKQQLVYTELSSLGTSALAIDLNNDVLKFVDPKTGELCCTISWIQEGFLLNYPWCIEIDRISWIGMTD